jgi:hypothetical protein
MALEKEVETYKRELPSLLKDEGKFVVIHENEVAGSYDTYDDALKVGYDKFGLKDFMVKKIEATERVLFFAGDLCAI